jgi:hypothetical protein
MRIKKCSPGKHQDRRMRGGNHIECIVCKDIFPCRHACEHFDCMLATGRPLPDWVTHDPADTPAFVASIMDVTS